MQISLPKSRTALIVLAIAAIAVMAVWPWFNRQNLTPTPVREVARLNETLSDGTLKIPRGGITLDDGTYLNTVAAIGRRGDVLISDGEGDETYHITWLRLNNEYLLSIQAEPYEENRKRAEDEYLAVIGNGSIAEACKRSVRVVAASWITPHPDALPEYCIS